MQRPARPHHAIQLDLFQPASRLPDWQQLPVEVREKAIRLMVRMLRENKTPEEIALGTGGGDDD